MIFKDIDMKALFQLMQEHDIAETILEDGKAKVVVKRNKEPGVLSSGATSAGEAPVLAEGEKNEGSPEEKGDVAAEAASDNYSQILAPLVGTFYQASAPDAAPFLEVGDQIDVGDVVCIVEAMKSMNEIQSEVKGTVKEICVENAQLVEFEQVLFKIEAI